MLYQTVISTVCKIDEWLLKPPWKGFSLYGTTVILCHLFIFGCICTAYPTVLHFPEKATGWWL